MAKGYQKGHIVSDETRKKISEARSNKVEYNCDMCGITAYTKPSHYNKKKRHFCSRKCYSDFIRTKMPKEEQNRYGTGCSKEEHAKKVKCRSITNKAIQRNILLRQPCEECGAVNTEAHHDNYDEPLNVRWLCFKHHTELHKQLRRA